MPTGIAVPAPTAFLEMCVRSAIECQEDGSKTLEEIAHSARALLGGQVELALASLPPSTIPAPLERSSQFDISSNASGRDLTQKMREDAVSYPNDETFPRLVWTKKVEALLTSINTQVNNGLIPKSDAETYHVSDYWNAPGLSGQPAGDCEDYALEKRSLLVAFGLVPTSLTIALVRTSAGDSHAVLLVASSEGDFVLDNLSTDIKTWDTTSYTWISRQTPSDDLAWVSLAGTRTPWGRDVTRK